MPNPKEIDHEIKDIHGVRLFVRQYAWPDGASTFSVVRIGDEELLDDEDFDHMPTDEEIAEHANFGSWKLESRHAFHTAPETGCPACEAIDPGTWRERYADPDWPYTDPEY